MSEVSTLARLIMDVNEDEALKQIKIRAKTEDPLQILDECKEGMVEVGKMFEQGEYFLSELLLSGEIFRKATLILEPYLAKGRPAEALGKVILAAPKGDIHDLGKGIVATLLKAQGFEVHDLGVDVDTAVIVEKVREIKPDIVGLSVLITTAFASTKDVVDKITEIGMRDTLKVVIGGGSTNETTRQYVGADFQTCDAVIGVNYCAKLMKEA